MRQPARDAAAELKARVHGAVVSRLGAEIIYGSEGGDDLAERVRRAVREELSLDRTPLSRDERRLIEHEIADDVLGHGPLEPYLRDDTVTEIMVNGPDQIWVERKGKIERDGRHASSTRSTSSGSSTGSCRSVGRRIDEALADGRRAPPRRLARERDHAPARAATDRR